MLDPRYVQNIILREGEREAAYAQRTKMRTL